MVIKDSPEFNPQFPEQFRWRQLDSRSLTEVAVFCVDRIRGEALLIPDQRHSTAGCRAVLNFIAEMEPSP